LTDGEQTLVCREYTQHSLFTPSRSEAIQQPEVLIRLVINIFDGSTLGITVQRAVNGGASFIG
jgi:hypothetical protein